MIAERCFSCTASAPRLQGPTHEYMSSSPGCWKLFTGLLDELNADASAVDALQDAVDAYAVQHPGSPGRREAQSVHVHLASLHLGLDRGFDAAARRKAMQALLRGRPAFPWLAVPPFGNAMTIADITACRTPAARRAAIRAWAASAWDAWKTHRATIVGLVTKVVR